MDAHLKHDCFFTVRRYMFSNLQIHTLYSTQCHVASGRSCFANTAPTHILREDFNDVSMSGSILLRLTTARCLFIWACLGVMLTSLRWRPEQPRQTDIFLRSFNVCCCDFTNCVLFRTTKLVLNVCYLYFSRSYISFK